MNAEALIGTVLGTCTLQKLVGQGGMGAVFLAQQSRPKRQVAVKVLLPMLPLAPNQRTAFLERFRRETDVVAALEHPNIMPVHEYGERDGLAYLVMPYINGGTLRDEMEREGKLPLGKAVFYLEQIAAAIACAHELGVIHRDIKPANILLRREGRLLLADFGLVKIISEGQDANSRLTGAGLPMGTPDYMAPEQVVGGEIDTRADLYSLGIVLYHMLTGQVPFQGQMPMQVAMQHIHNPPPSPRSLRPDLPAVAEQVLLRALAKRPADRYTHVLDFTSAFRQALTVSGVPLPDVSNALSSAGLTDTHLFTPRSLFDPVWQGGPPTANENMQNNNSLAGMLPLSPNTLPGNDIVLKTSIPMPSLAGFLPPDTPLPPKMNAQSSSMPQERNASAHTVRSGIGHKMNLRRPVDARDYPFAPPVEVPAEQQAQPGPLPVAPEGSPPQFSPTNPPSMSEGLGTRPSPTGLFGRSGLRSFAPVLADGEGSPLPRHAGEENIPPLTSSPQEGSGMGLFMSMKNRMPPVNPPSGIGMGQFNPTTNATGLFGNAQPFNGFTPPAPNPGTEQPFNGFMQPVPNAGMEQPPNGFLPPAPHTGMGQPFNGFLPPAPNPGTDFNGSLSQAGNALVPSISSNGTQQLTGALVMGNVEMSGGTGNTGMMKLGQATKVVQYPVPGQPGRYMTGLLPVLEEARPALPPHIASRVASVDALLKGRLKAAILIVAALVILLSSVALWQGLAHSGQATTNALTAATPDVAVTATANAVATANANIIVADSLDGTGGNIHNWPLATTGPLLYQYKNGAYHITVNGDHPAIALLPSSTSSDTFVYTLTMQAVQGDEGNVDNRFGLILRYNMTTKKGVKVATFYCLEVSNIGGGTYQFMKYDDSLSDANGPAPWVNLWPGAANTQNYGKEYHFGHGPKNQNTFKIIVNGSKFAFVVNGKQVGTVQDKSLTGGQMGMFVNLKGTEVAFSNFLLTYK